MPVLLYASEAMIWREKERSGIRAVEMDNLRCLLGIRRKDRVRKTQIIELCKVAKGVDKRLLHWFGHTERIKNDRIAKSVYVREFVVVP